MDIKISEPDLQKAAEASHSCPEEVIALLKGGESSSPPGRIYYSESSLSQKIWAENQGQKRVNGHSPEYIAEKMGIPVDVLFPRDGLTLYIGDPWQRLDRPNVVLLDYEYGPVVEFQAERPLFLKILESRLAAVSRTHCSRRNEEDHTSVFVSDHLAEMKKLQATAQKAKLEDLPALAQRFTQWRKEIEVERTWQAEEQESLDERVEDLWYLGLHGERIIDIYDWETQLREKYESYGQSLPSNWSLKRREIALRSKRRELIESIRLKKTASEAMPVEGMFPFTPFKAGIFKSIVAYYSISSYVFPRLTKKEMLSYWQEIYRLLGKGDEAFIAPLFQRNDYIVDHTLAEFQEREGDFYYYLGEQDSLYIQKKGEKNPYFKKKDVFSENLPG
ncbi:hypothetical protein ACFLZP_01070 [Patescibacteria group bacterium]